MVPKEEAGGNIAAIAPDMAKLWHPTKNGALRPADITPGSRKRIWWQCGHGHVWSARPYTLKAGCACPYCAGKRAIPGETDLVTLRPDVMAQWDFEKNALNPVRVAVASHDKVWWKCEQGHSWQAVVFSRTRENAAGCPYCTGRLVLPGFNDLATRKPRLAEEWYFPLNGELRPDAVTPGSNKKVWWRCGAGHVWRAAVYSRTRAKGSGCPVCAGMTRPRKDGGGLRQTAQHSAAANEPPGRANA